MADEELPPAPSGGGNKLLPIILVVNSVLVVGVLAAVLLRGPSSAPAPAEGAKSSGEGKSEHGDPNAPVNGLGPTVHFADFVIHLRNPEQDRYARLALDVEVANDRDKADVTAHVPQIRDAFIAFLSDRTLEDLRGSAELKQTKAELFSRLTPLVPSATIRAIYITDLVVQ